VSSVGHPIKLKRLLQKTYSVLIAQIPPLTTHESPLTTFSEPQPCRLPKIKDACRSKSIIID
jgi:hypothetical protein